MGIDKALKDALRVFQHIGGFSDTDKALLKKHGPDLISFIPAVTDTFYQQLLDEEQTAKYIEGRVEHLKATHINWISSLFCGDYDDAFMEAQLKIGVVHVEVGIPPLFVASSMSYLRSAMAKVIEKELKDKVQCITELSGAIVRVLDLCHFLVDYAYEKDRLKRLTQATGLSLPLLENLIALKRPK
ncbi:MAG: hypothetical protein GXP14_14275 [Gammaproteobacteria bacterium]|nr:hypothetical protein [Gammaproteobacteria bacterium]